MLTKKYANTIKQNLENHNVMRFLVIMIFLGIGINNFEPYPKFGILFFVLLIISCYMIIVLKHCINQMLEFTTLCQKTNIFKSELEILFPQRINILIGLIYIFILIIYFLNLFNLQFISLNIMGIYILIWGIFTLIMALIAYETYIRVTIFLSKVASDEKSWSQNYNIVLPCHTNWLQSLHQLSKTLRIDSLIMGLFFVLENTLIFYANINILNEFISNANISIWKKAMELPLEFWAIWGLVFIAIAVAFPIIALLQTSSIKNIINKIKNIYSDSAILKFESSTEKKQIVDYYILMMMVKNTEASLIEKYMPQKSNKFITFLVSFLTCILHLTTLFNLIII